LETGILDTGVLEIIEISLLVFDSIAISESKKNPNRRFPIYTGPPSSKILFFYFLDSTIFPDSKK